MSTTHPANKEDSHDGSTADETEQHIESDMSEFFDELVSLNKMAVVNDRGMVGELDIKFDTDYTKESNRDVFSLADDHPVHVKEVYFHGVVVFAHDRASEVRR